MKKRIIFTLLIAVVIFLSASLITPLTASANRGAYPYLNITAKDVSGNVINSARITLIPPTGYATRTIDVSDGIAGFNMDGYPTNVNYTIQAWNPIPPSDNRDGSKTYSYTSGTANTDIILNINY